MSLFVGRGDGCPRGVVAASMEGLGNETEGSILGGPTCEWRQERSRERGESEERGWSDGEIRDRRVKQTIALGGSEVPGCP